MGKSADPSCHSPDYELGRLYADMGQNAKATEQFELVLSGGKGIKTNPNKAKGSISLRVSPVLASRQLVGGKC